MEWCRCNSLLLSHFSWTESFIWVSPAHLCVSGCNRAREEDDEGIAPTFPLRENAFVVLSFARSAVRPCLSISSFFLFLFLLSLCKPLPAKRECVWLPPAALIFLQPRKRSFCHALQPVIFFLTLTSFTFSAEKMDWAKGNQVFSVNSDVHLGSDLYSAKKILSHFLSVRATCSIF